MQFCILNYCSILVNHVLYWSFDSLENLNITLRNFTGEAQFDPQVPGKVYSLAAKFKDQYRIYIMTLVITFAVPVAQDLVHITNEKVTFHNSANNFQFYLNHTAWIEIICWLQLLNIY